MTRDPFDDEGLAADLNAVCLTSILCAHAQVSLGRAMANAEAAHVDAIEAAQRLEEAIVELHQWADRAERAVELHALAVDRAPVT